MFLWNIAVKGWWHWKMSTNLFGLETVWIHHGWQNKADWGEGNRREASVSEEMMLLLSAHPIMISAHASIHFDSQKLWEQMTQITLGLYSFQLSCFLIFFPFCRRMHLHFFAISSVKLTAASICEFSAQVVSHSPFSHAVFNICSSGPFDAVCPWGMQNLRGSLGCHGIPNVLHKARPG